MKGNQQIRIKLGPNKIKAMYSSFVLSKKKSVNRADWSIDYCGGGFAFKPYDSHKLPLASTIVYFQGETDPQTPLSGALYHFNGQLNKINKYFYKTVFSGHSPIQTDLSACSSEIWKKLISKNYNLVDVLDSSGHCLEHRKDYVSFWTIFNSIFSAFNGKTGC